MCERKKETLDYHKLTEREQRQILENDESLFNYMTDSPNREYTLESNIMDYFDFRNRMDLQIMDDEVLWLKYRLGEELFKNFWQTDLSIDEFARKYNLGEIKG